MFDAPKYTSLIAYGIPNAGFCSEIVTAISDGLGYPKSKFSWGLLNTPGGYWGIFCETNFFLYTPEWFYEVRSFIKGYKASRGWDMGEALIFYS